MRSNDRRRATGGFTLLEILVVVLIITILATVVGINVAHEPGKARVAAAKAHLVTFRSALQLYRMDNGTFPTQEQGLDALCRMPSSPPIPKHFREGGYLDSPNLPTDPWGNPYVYLVPGVEGQPFEIVTYGADTQPGGTDDNADLSSSSL